MRGDLDVLDQRRVAPDADAVVREAGRAGNLLVVGAPLERRDLAARVDAVDAAARGRVPEVDVAVVAAAAGGEQVVLPGTPRERLDGRVVVGLLELGRLQRARVPDGDEVVVAARRELRAVRSPLEPAHFARVGVERGDFVRCDSHVVVEEPAVARTRGEDVLVPA